MSRAAPNPALTPREREVVRLVAQGYTNRDISSLLGIGRETVKTHMKKVLAKLHLSSRMEATLWWATEGSRSNDAKIPQMGDRHAN